MSFKIIALYHCKIAKKNILKNFSLKEYQNLMFDPFKNVA